MGTVVHGEFNLAYSWRWDGELDSQVTVRNQSVLHMEHDHVKNHHQSADKRI